MTQSFKKLSRFLRLTIDRSIDSIFDYRYQLTKKLKIPVLTILTILTINTINTITMNPILKKITTKKILTKMMMMGMVMAAVSEMVSMTCTTTKTTTCMLLTHHYALAPRTLLIINLFYWFQIFNVTSNNVIKQRSRL